jgi:hypothetical protein
MDIASISSLQREKKPMHPVDHIKNRQKSKKFMPAKTPAPSFSALPASGGAGPMPAAPSKRRPAFLSGHAPMGNGR